MFNTTLCIQIEAVAVVSLIICLAFMAILIRLTILNMHSFLAKNSPVKADILVVEGWLPDYALKSAITEFKQGLYSKLITIGGELPRGFYLSQYKTFAELASATLIALDFEPDQLLTVSDLHQSQNRTQSSIEILHQWLSTSELRVKALNIYTLGTHSRRSWLLFKQIFEPEILVGVISVEPLNYDSKRWWNSSEGVRTVIPELIAYLYMHLFRI